MIYTINLNVAIDKTATIDKLEINSLNRLDQVEVDAGGKGINVAKDLKAFGINAIALGIMPQDGSDFIKQALDKLDIKYSFVLIDGQVRTNLKLIDKNGNLTEINEAGISPSLSELQTFNEELEKILKEGDSLIITGSLPKNVSCDYYASLINLAKNKKVKTILDADGETFKHALKAKPNIIKPNRFELIQYFNLDDDISNEALLNYGKLLLNDETKIVILSLGKDGAYFIKKDQVIKTEALNLKIKSSVGAGDAMVAATAYAFNNHLPFTYLARLATAAASAACVSSGTKEIDIELINNFINEIKYQII